MIQRPDHDLPIVERPATEAARGASPVAPTQHPQAATKEEVAATLGVGKTGHRGSRLRWLRHRWWWSIPVIGVVIAVVMNSSRSGGAPPSFQTSAIRRGDLSVTVAATGSLAPLDTVNVGTEVSGVVDQVTVDYNDHVRAGQPLAIINTDQIKDELSQRQATLASANAAALQSAATLGEVSGQTARTETLFQGAFASKQDVETARAALSRAQAADAQARANVTGAAAALQAEQTALEKATIRSPINGVVLERQVERGRTVTAAFQTPVLFVLAANLERMTLALDIDEADVGRVQPGQQADFTVDAFPDLTFTARVRTLHNAARTVEGVVTYQALLDVDNAGLKLRPGMTATATIRTAGVTNVLMAPNAALRFTPANGAADSARPAPIAAHGLTHRLWTLRGGAPVAIPVTTGLTDGSWTEITSGDVREGEPLLVNTAEPAKPSGGFSLFGRGRGGR
jgi:HlyD family secretion protein